SPTARSRSAHSRTPLLLQASSPVDHCQSEYSCHHPFAPDSTQSESGSAAWTQPASDTDASWHSGAFAPPRNGNIYSLTSIVLAGVTARRSLAAHTIEQLTLARSRSGPKLIASSGLMYENRPRWA